MYIWIAIGIIILSYLIFSPNSAPKEITQIQSMTLVPIAQPTPGSLQVSIFSYNVLARMYEKFQDVSEEYRDYRFRINKIVRDIQTSLMQKVKSDFICLQEVDTYNEQFNDILQANGYESIFVKRPRLYHSDGCVLAWKKISWDMVQLKQIDFNSHPYAQKYSDFFRDNVGIIGMFEHKATNKRVLVATAHFFWNPEYEYVKFGQAEMLLDIVTQFYLDQPEIPILICGDFNSLPDSNVIRLFQGEAPIKSPTIKQEHFSIIQELYKPNQLIFQSAYSSYKPSHPLTNFTKLFQGCLDYILYTSS